MLEFECFNLRSYDFESRKWIRGDNKKEVPINLWAFHNLTHYKPIVQPIVQDRIVFEMRNDVLSVFTVDINPINSFGQVIFSRTASKASIFFKW